MTSASLPVSSPDDSIEDSIMRIGRVVSVKGRTIEVEVDKSKNTSNLVYRGELVTNISVGGYVKIAKGFTRMVGKVEGEYIDQDPRVEGVRRYQSSRQRIRRVLTISLLGFFRGSSFERGVKELPLLDNECLLLQRKEFEQVHNFLSPDDVAISIGALAFEKGQSIQVGVNSLFASHIGIFGNTGSGKSYTLAKLYCELFQKFGRKRGFQDKARFLLLDFNGEYIDESVDADSIIVDRRHKSSYRLSTRQPNGDKLPFPASALNDSEFWVIFLEATEKTQSPFVRRAIANTAFERLIEQEGGIKKLLSSFFREALVETDNSIDKLSPGNMLKELEAALGGNASIRKLISDYQRNLKFHSGQSKFYYQQDGERIYSDSTNFLKVVIEEKIGALSVDEGRLGPIDRIRTRIVLQYYFDVVRGFSNREHLAPLLKRLDKRIDDLRNVVKVSEAEELLSRSFTVVSLKDVSMHMRKVLPLLLCKIAYANKRNEGDRDKYLNIIIDEAHNILSDKSDRESEQWKDYRLETFEEIIKEGRKFGVFLTVASQRPADISPTVISQLHNYFLHRLINNEDIDAVRQTISYLDRVSFESLPMLPTGTCIFAGLVASIPVVVDIGEIKPRSHEPRNKTITLTESWG